MGYDLKSMTRKELSILQKDIEKALKSSEKRERRNARKAAEKAVAEFGFSLDDISNAPKVAAPTKAKKGKVGRPKKKAAAKYRNPADPEQTWSGRGRKPLWINAALENGADITDLEI